MFLAQDILRIETAKEKQDKQICRKNNNKVGVRNMEEWNVCMKGKISNQEITITICAKDLQCSKVGGTQDIFSTGTLPVYHLPVVKYNIVV